jgi:general bacterial porin, GBP family
MKKSLMALAVLGALSGAASAQSSVTIYGIVDIGVQWNEFGVNLGTAAAPNWSQESVWAIQSGYQSGSRFGLRGSEALGKGWNAVFTLEGGVNVDTGTSAQSGQLFGRQAWAGLQHNSFGTVALGRIATPSSGTGSFDLFGSVDPFSTGWGLIGLQATFIPSTTLREDNSIIWASPTWAGFKFAAQYSLNVFGQETAPNSTNTTAVNLGANWTWGPLFVAATYDIIEYPDPTTATPCLGTVNGCPDQKMLQVGAVWDFKFLKLHGAWANQDDISFSQTIGGAAPILPASGFLPLGVGSYNNNAWMVGVTVPLFGGSLLGSYQYSDAKNIISPVNGAQFEPDYSVWGIGYTYPFSRRTNMYIGYGQREWDGEIRTVGGAGVLTQASQAFDRSQFALGIRHLF